MPEKAPVHVRVARTHPDFAYHCGEITTLSRETFDQYAEKGAFFVEITANEAKKAASAVETATVPQEAERAVVPVEVTATTPKAEKAAISAPKTAPKGHK